MTQKDVLILTRRLSEPAGSGFHGWLRRLTRDLSRRYSVKVFDTGLSGAGRTRPLRFDGRVQVVTPSADLGRQFIARCLRDFLTGHGADLIVFLELSTAEVYSPEIREFCPRKPILGLLQDSQELRDLLNMGSLPFHRRWQRLRAWEEGQRNLDALILPSSPIADPLGRIFPNTIPVTVLNGTPPHAALREFEKLRAPTKAELASRTRLVFVADGPLPLAARTLGALERHTPSTCDFTWVGPTPPKKFSKWSFRRHICVPANSQGILEGLNQALSESRGEFAAVVRCGAVVPPGWLDRLLGWFRHPLVGAAGPWVHEGKALSRDALQQAAAWSLRERDKILEGALRLHHACWVLRRDALQQAGLPDSRLPWSAAAADYGLRLRQAGFKLVEVRDVYVHFVRPAAESETGREILMEKWQPALPPIGL